MTHTAEALIQLARLRAADIAAFAARRIDILKQIEDPGAEAALWQLIEADAAQVQTHIGNALQAEQEKPPRLTRPRREATLRPCSP